MFATLQNTYDTAFLGKILTIINYFCKELPYQRINILDILQVLNRPLKLFTGNESMVINSNINGGTKILATRLTVTIVYSLLLMNIKYFFPVIKLSILAAVKESSTYHTFPFH